MKIKSFLRSTGVKLAGLALLVGALTSCGGKELSKVIPADIKVACRFDLKQTALNAGCSFNEKGQLELSPEINAVLGNDIETMAKVKMALMMTEGFDMSDVVFFMRTNNEPVFVASLSDEAQVVKNITALFGEPESADGYQVFYPSGKGQEPVVAVKDARAWLASDLVTISDAIDAADKKHIGTMPGIQQFLDGDNAFALVVSPSALNALPSNFYDQWVCGSLKFDDKISSGELCMMDADGKRYPFGETFGEMSTDFLRYVPADMNVVGALGPIESQNVRSMISMLATNLGSEGKYLTDLDGTIALALDFSDVAPGNFAEILNPNKYDFKSLKGLLMVHYPQQTADDLVTTVSDLLSLQGQIVGDGPDNLKTFTFDSVDFYMGNVDGYFSVANFPIVPDAENELATKFNGRRGALYSYSKAMPDWGLNFASESIIWLEKDAIKGKCELIGADKPFLQSMISYLLSPQMRQLFKSLTEGDIDDYEMEYFHIEEPGDDFIDDSDFDAHDIEAIEAVELDI